MEDDKKTGDKVPHPLRQWRKIEIPRWKAVLMLILLLLASGSMLIHQRIEFQRALFDQTAQYITREIRTKLQANETVLNEFSEFIQKEGQDIGIIEPGLKNLSQKLLDRYPHIYMLELAEGVSRIDEVSFMSHRKHHGHSQFSFKSFSDITGRPTGFHPGEKQTWPIIFMYPEVPEAQAIFGLRLETVDYLKNALAACENSEQAITSPVFQMIEGDLAYILLRRIHTTEPDQIHQEPGKSMIGLVLIKANALRPEFKDFPADPDLQFSAAITARNNPETPLFARIATASSPVEQMLLPKLHQRIQIHTLAQQLVIVFDKQLRWSDLLGFTF